MLRCIFSIRANSSISDSVVVSLIMAGIVCISTMAAACNRLCPAMSLYSPVFSVRAITIGCKIPCLRIDSANSASSSVSTVVRGCLGFSRIDVMDGSRRSSKANAYFSGLGKNKRIALFDTLIEKHFVNQGTSTDRQISKH